MYLDFSYWPTLKLPVGELHRPAGGRYAPRMAASEQAIPASRALALQFGFDFGDVCRLGPQGVLSESSAAIVALHDVAGRDEEAPLVTTVIVVIARWLIAKEVRAEGGVPRFPCVLA